jgi:hypothetical protein
MIIHFRICIVSLLILGVFSAHLNAQKAPKIIMEQQKAVAVSFAAQGNPDSWQVYKKESRQPLPGKREVSRGSLLFRPVIAFQPGISYVIKQIDVVKYEFSPPATEQVSPEIVQIYPTADRLPSNLLKFYVQFSRPMSEAEPYPALHLVDAKNDTLKNTFLKQLPALWNRDRTILSLWLDPGRIKRNLNLNRKLGNPLQGNNDYTLLIEESLKSSDGIKLQSSAQKTFSAVDADRQKPSIGSWKIDVPEKASTRPLIIQFDEAMDYLSTAGRITVTINGETVKGESTFRNNQREWIFTPARAWKQGDYALRVDARIEDLAGNNLNRLFDREIKTQDQERDDKTFHMIEFDIE